MRYLILVILLCGCASVERIAVYKHPTWNDYVYIYLPRRNDVKYTHCQFIFNDGSRREVLVENPVYVEDIK